MNRRNAIKNISIGMGLTVSTGTLLTMISACKSEPAKVVDPWTPTFFKNPDHVTLLQNLVDIILPPTDTPGAKEAGVHKYVDMAVGELYKPKKQERFQKGMEECIKKLEAEHGEVFTKLSTEQLTAFLESHIGAKADKETYDASRSLANSKDLPEDEAQHSSYYLYSFLTALKSLTVSGYFGSQLIGTEHMNYIPVPGPYKGCIDYSGNNYSLF